MAAPTDKKTSEFNPLPKDKGTNSLSSLLKKTDENANEIVGGETQRRKTNVRLNYMLELLEKLLMAMRHHMEQLRRDVASHVSARSKVREELDEVEGEPENQRRIKELEDLISVKEQALKECERELEKLEEQTLELKHRGQAVRHWMSSKSMPMN